MLCGRKASISRHVQQQSTAGWQLLETAAQEHQQLADRWFVQQIFVWIITEWTRSIAILNVALRTRHTIRNATCGGTRVMRTIDQMSVHANAHQRMSRFGWFTFQRLKHPKFWIDSLVSIRTGVTKRYPLRTWTCPWSTRRTWPARMPSPQLGFPVD